MKNPFNRSRNHDPKLRLLRKADTERDTAYTIGGSTRLMKKKPISLAPVPSLDNACIDCDGTGRYPTGAACKSCGGSGRVLPGDGVAVSAGHRDA